MLRYLCPRGSGSTPSTLKWWATKEMNLTGPVGEARLLVGRASPLVQEVVRGHTTYEEQLFESAHQIKMDSVVGWAMPGVLEPTGIEPF